MATNSKNCKAHSIDFLLSEGDPEMATVDKYIAQDLAQIGISVNTRFFNDSAYIDARSSGEYHLVFTRTWGAPYDPHSFLSSDFFNSSIGNLEPPLTRAMLTDRIAKVQQEKDFKEIQRQWRNILDDVHQQAIFIPLWGTRIPYVVNRRLVGFSPSYQAFSIPVNSLQIVTGSKNVTISPGVGSLVMSAGPINPHQYAPNALWAQDWIYEGLVSYGQDGEILPALAKSWVVDDIGEGHRATFQLRQGVTFHDGTPFDCQAVKLNLDHVLSDTVRRRHQWLGVGKYLKSWTCTNDFELVLETTRPFYPLLQELTYIRPLRFASPAVFAKGLDSHPDDHNSCESGHFGAQFNYLEDTVTCMGLTAPVGTGPFKYVGRETDADGSDRKVIFARNEDYWGKIPVIEFLTAVQYASTEEVEDALKSGELDMALGIGPLTALQVQNLKFYHSAQFDVQQPQ